MSNQAYKKPNKGFIALFSVIIISFVLLIMTVTLNLSGMFGRFNIFDSENKERSANLAYGCIEYARLQIAATGFSGTDSLEIDGEECQFRVSGNSIESCSVVNKAHTYYEVALDLDDPALPILDFEEVSNPSSNFCTL